MASGIYKIENKINGKLYIGSAVNIEARWRGHRCDLEKGKHHSSILQRAWRKYGSEAFSFVSLMVCAKEDLIFYEQRALDVMLPSYNICRVAGSSLGCKMPDSMKEKMSNRVISAETREKLRAAALGNTYRRGKKTPADVVEVIAKAKTGVPLTEEHKNKIREANLGHSVSQEVRDAISKAQKGNTHTRGRKVSEETKEKISKALTGRVFSEETKAKMKAARNKRGPVSEETRAKMSAAQRRRFKCIYQK